MKVKVTGTINLTLDIEPIEVSEHHEVTTDWINRVIAAGGTVAETTADAVDEYIYTLEENSLWTKMSTNSIIMLYATDTFAGLFEPLVRPSGVTPVNHGFESGDYGLTTGLNPGLTNNTKRVNLDYNPHTWLTLGSAQISIYSRTELDGATGGNLYPIECSATVGDDRMGLSVKLTYWQGNTVYDNWNCTSGRVATQTGGTGLITGSRISVTDERIYRNGSQVGTTNTTDQTGKTIVNLPIWEFGNNLNGAYDSPSCRIHAYSYVGPALTSVEEAIHYPAVQAFETTLGRQV